MQVERVVSVLPTAVPDDPRSPTGLFVGPVKDPDRYQLLGGRLKGDGAGNEPEPTGRRGGEGQVWRGSHGWRQPDSPQDAAVKILFPPASVVATTAVEEQRWQQHIRLLSLCDSSHLVRIWESFVGWVPHGRGAYEVGQVPDTWSRTRYVVMEWVDGSTLQELGTDRSIPMADRFRHLIGLAEGVDHLHSGARSGTQLLHRDIKPSNVIINPARGAVLVDFGSARAVGPDHSVQQTWASGYTAPEVLRDLTSYSVRSDLWSLGAVAFFLATGEAPGGGRGSAAGTGLDEETLRHQIEECARAERIGRPLQFVDLMMHMLAFDPDKRWPGKDPLTASGRTAAVGRGSSMPPSRASSRRLRRQDPSAGRKPRRSPRQPFFSSRPPWQSGGRRPTGAGRPLRPSPRPRRRRSSAP